MSCINVFISWGEAIDKLTILSIKSQHISDHYKLSHIQKEKSGLEQNVVSVLRADQMEAFEKYKKELLVINQILWDLEDKIRIFEEAQNFKDEFITIARSIYKVNDERFKIKSTINIFFESNVKEMKSYMSL